MANVPKFGNWEKEQVQYTVFFENARVKKGAGGHLMNPNDPEENPGAFNNQTNIQEEERRERARQYYNREQRPRREEIEDREQRPRREEIEDREQRPRREEIEDREPWRSPYHASSNQKEEIGEGNGPFTAFPKKNNPLRPKFTQQVEEIREGKGPSTNPTKNNPLRPQFTQQVEENHRAVSVPKFGDWNAGNVDGGGGYTMIFEKMKENKQNGVINPQVPAYTASPRLQQNQRANAHKPAKSSMLCCFGH